MKFCPQCESHMTKNTLPAGSIIYKCKCQNEVLSEDVDTLMAEGYVAAEESELKHEVFIENSPFDLAANLVDKPCLKCKVPFLTLVRVGINQQTIFTCTCGFKATNKEYSENAP